MDDSFFAYLQLLELLAFFSGYPLIYTVIISVAGNQTGNELKKRIVSLLPLAYALIGTLYLGLQLKNLYTGYSLVQIKNFFYHPYLIGWALLSILFFIPAFRKKNWLSLVHSLIFFLIIARDFFLQFFGSTWGNDSVKNGIKIYTISLILNLAALALLVLLSFLFNRFKKS